MPKRFRTNYISSSDSDEDYEAIYPSAEELEANFSSYNHSGRPSKFRKIATSVEARLDRALSEPLFLIQRNKVNETQQEFAVLGSTGNVYTVTICQTPKCTCPDATAGGNRCKHILFVLVKVLKQREDSSLMFQKTLSGEELRQVFAAAPQQVRADVLAPEPVQRAYTSHMARQPSPAASTSTTSATPSSATASGASSQAQATQRREVQGDSCGVCFEAMSYHSQKIVHCQDCNNHLHEECWNKWKQSRQRIGERPECVYCRSPNMGNKKKVAIRRSSNRDQRYLNLSSHQQASQRHQHSRHSASNDCSDNDFSEEDYFDDSSDYSDDSEDDDDYDSYNSSCSSSDDEHHDICNRHHRQHQRRNGYY